MDMAGIKINNCEKVKEENEELKMLLRKLSHEMGNALTLLGGSIYYLENEITDSETVCNITNLKNDYKYICSLFKDLRDYNHTESFEKKRITLKELSEDIKNTVIKMPGSEMTEFVLDYSGCTGEAAIYADVTRMRQVLINIIKNSIEAMEENGSEKGKHLNIRLEITNMKDEDKNRIFRGLIKKEYVHIAICDNGKGISKNHLKDIFQPMFTYGKKEGTGLGLSVVKKIVEDHDGKIKAVSAPGTGTAIHIYIPVMKTIMKSQTVNQACEAS